MGNATYPSNQRPAVRTGAVQGRRALLLSLLLLVAACGGGVRGEVGVYLDAGGSLDGSRAPVGDGDQRPDRADSSIEGECGASADVKAVRKPTTVWLIVETHGLLASTNTQAFGENVTGWTALREILIGSQGLVPTFESVVRFGVVFHSGVFDRACPSLHTLDPELHNGARIAAFYPLEASDLWGGTGGAVTYKALDFIEPRLADSDTGTGQSGKEILIIAKTHGESLCWADSSSVPDRAKELLRERLTRVVAKGVQAFILRIPLLSDTSVAFENELARIGGTEKAYTPMNAAEMRLDFEKILRDSVSCEITLNGDVTDGSECQGTVEVDGVEIPCSSEDGWRLKDPRTIELVGSACTDLRSRPTAQIKADFPCGIILF